MSGAGTAGKGAHAATPAGSPTGGAAAAVAAFIGTAVAAHWARSSQWLVVVAEVVVVVEVEVAAQRDGPSQPHTDTAVKASTLSDFWSFVDALH